MKTKMKIKIKIKIIIIKIMLSNLTYISTLISLIKSHILEEEMLERIQTNLFLIDTKHEDQTILFPVLQ